MKIRFDLLHCSKSEAMSRPVYILSLLVVFTLYTIPLCQCAVIASARESSACCASLGKQVDCTDESSCCASGAHAEKMNTEKSFESALVCLLMPSLLGLIEFPVVLMSPKHCVTPPLSILSPPTCAFLQVFLI